MTQLSKEAQALFDKYAAGSAPAPEQPQFELSQNGRNRMQETLRRTGIDRESPEALKTATLRALAEQRGQLPANEGVGGRGYSNSTYGVRQGRSLSDMANPVKSED